MNDLYCVAVIKEDGSAVRASRPCSKEEAAATLEKMQRFGCNLPLEVRALYTVSSM